MAKQPAKPGEARMNALVSLCKRRGFVFPSSEVYGGIGSCWDYGPLGAELKLKIKRAWWQAMTYARDDIEGLDAAILMHPRVWEASGHVEGFTDPLVDCKACQQRFREDDVETEGVCPACGGELTPARQFNLMFKTFMGPVEDDASQVYLRPETAQGIYVNFGNVLGPSRQKLPFGIAQIGKAFRNEITPGNFIFRTREFEQMEMQYFVAPDDADRWFDTWRELRWQWYESIGIDTAHLRWEEHGPGELAHYAKKAFDIQYEFPFGWQELEGIHNRGDYDLSRHQEYSGKKTDLTYFDPETKERFTPHIIETSAGCDRTILAVLADAYDVENPGDPKEERVVMRFHPKLAPITLAVLPLVKKAGMPEVAREIADTFRGSMRVFYDEKGAIGRRYRRQDEAGTPFCVTVDGQTLEDGTVTLRERDSMEQQRLKIEDIHTVITPAIQF